MLRLTVHNIGSAAAAASQGELFADSVRIATVEWPAVEAPLDFRARRAVVEVPWTPARAGSHGLRLVLAERDGIFSGNNQWRTTVDVQER